MWAQVGLELTILLPQLPVLPPDHRLASSRPSENIVVVFETGSHVAQADLELSV